jgi:hypothetical protein
MASASPIPLPVPDPKVVRSKQRQPQWEIATWTNPEACTVTTRGLMVEFKPKTVGMRSGTGFKAPAPIPPNCESATFSYEVYVDEDFDFVKGGKLPGFCIGANGECASGGNWRRRGGSLRLMWREKGFVIGYLYLPTDISKEGTREGTADVQSTECRKELLKTRDTRGGWALWHRDAQKPHLRLRKGSWNAIRVHVSLNDVGEEGGEGGGQKGEIRVSVNGAERRCRGVVFRKDKGVRIQSILFSTFFGGSTRDWAPRKKERMWFRNFSLETR